MLYLDTNIFLYLSDKNSPYHSECVALINQCDDEKVSIATSTETIQEIIHYSKNTKQLESGIVICENAMKLVNRTLAIKRKTINIFLEKAKVYKNVSSRDLIHLSVCVENEIKNIVTYDKHFSKFKEIKSSYPKELLKKL